LTVGQLETSNYGFGRNLDVPFAETVSKVQSAPKVEDLGVLAEIDIQKAMKEKLGVDFRDYLILEDCNPPLAHRALSVDMEVGLLLPCNVVVYSDGENSVARVLDPEVALGISSNDALGPFAAEAKKRLAKVVAALA
jgi:uncharacterized protein (DUF302 family)